MTHYYFSIDWAINANGIEVDEKNRNTKIKFKSIQEVLSLENDENTDLEKKFHANE